MLDRPDAATLLKAMSATLTKDVLPNTSGGTRHAVRVVANLCLILEREVAMGANASHETRLALTNLLGVEGTLPELVESFDRALREGDFAFDPSVHALLKADVERRLAIDRPGYDSQD